MDQNPKQQAVEKLKGASTVLITTSNNPSIDQLTAALGLGQMLKKLGKSVTTTITATIPKKISFLEADKQFIDNLDSLRDFIISLDKKLADKLRYKVEGSEVRIFITPYHSRITKDDVRFSQGDFNVDAVVAIGVNTQNDIDPVVKKNSRVLSEAPVISISVGANPSAIGVIKWHDQQASSLSELMVSTSEAFQGNLLDEDISNTLLTGIIAATNHFTNADTSPKVMTMAAQLMAAGADQQKIMKELKTEESQNIIESAPQFNPSPASSQDNLNDQATSIQQDSPQPKAEDATNMAIQHDDASNQVNSQNNIDNNNQSNTSNNLDVASQPQQPVNQANEVVDYSAQNSNTLDDAKAAVEAAMSSQPSGTAFNPKQDLGARPFTTGTPEISPNEQQQTQQPTADLQQFQIPADQPVLGNNLPEVNTTPAQFRQPTGQVSPSSLYPPQA